MTIRFMLAVGLCLGAGSVQGDDKAPVTLSGTGKGPVEIRDSSGGVTEVITPKDLTLNQMPADAVAREKVYREKQNERARELEAQRETAAADVAAKEAEAVKAEEQAAAEAAAKALAAEEEFDPTPRKVRRNTVRGTRYVAREPVDPSLRTPENSGIKRVEPAEQSAPKSGNSQSWPPARPTQQLPAEKPLPTYQPN